MPLASHQNQSMHPVQTTAQMDQVMMEAPKSSESLVKHASNTLALDDDIVLGLDLIQKKLCQKKQLSFIFEDMVEAAQGQNFNLFSFCGAIWVALEFKSRRDVAQDYSGFFDFQQQEHHSRFKHMLDERIDNFLESFIFYPESSPFGDEFMHAFDKIRKKLDGNALLQMKRNERRIFLNHCRL